MNRILMSVLGTAIATMLLAATGAQSTDPAGGEGSATKVESGAKGHRTATSDPAIRRVKERGLKASAKDRDRVDKRLDEIEKQIENEASARGDAAVAARIAGEFGVAAGALTAERTRYRRGWGEILVAHTLLANVNTKMKITIDEMFRMRDQGLGWGVIAAGLHLQLGDVVSAVRSEGRVAAGLAKGDGRPARIRST